MLLHVVRELGRHHGIQHRVVTLLVGVLKRTTIQTEVGIPSGIGVGWWALRSCSSGRKVLGQGQHWDKVKDIGSSGDTIMCSHPAFWLVRWEGSWDLASQLPWGQHVLLHRPVVWITKSKPSVLRTWRRRSTKGMQDAGGRVGEDNKGSPKSSDEEGLCCEKGLEVRSGGK